MILYTFNLSIINMSETTSLLQNVSIGSRASEQRPSHNKLGISSTIFLLLNKSVGSGVFSVPASIFVLVGGSVKMSLFLWLLGGLLAYCGFCVYLDFGLKIPKSGAEKNYLMRVYRNPEYLAVGLFTVYSLCLGVSSGNSFAFGTYVLLALGYTDPNPWIARTIALVVLSTVCSVHALFPRFGRSLFNILGVTKVIVLIGISLSGAAVLVGLIKPELPADLIVSSQSALTIPKASSYSYAVALLRVIYSYRGWENGNFVLGEIHKPERTLRLAGPIAISLVTCLYLLCNASYFAVIPAELIQSSGTIIAGTFFRILCSKTSFSKTADTILPLLVALSNLGNVVVVTYGYGHMNKEFAKNGLIPKWFAKSWPEEIEEDEKNVIEGLRTSRGNSLDGLYDNYASYGSVYEQGSIEEECLKVDSTEPRTIEEHMIEFDHDSDKLSNNSINNNISQYISSPVAGLFLHWVASALTLILPPPGKVYDFIIDLSAYPGAMVATLVAAGLIYLRTHATTEDWPTKPYTAPWTAVLVYMCSNLFLVIIPLIPPPKASRSPDDMPYWSVPVATLVVCLVGLVYWKTWFRNR